MTFLNGILAFGAMAFSIPLILHLLNRNRFRTIQWGAMHLLESLLQARRRRLRIEQLLLLLVRCAIPVVLALCMARPVITAWRALPGNAASSLAIVLDDSYSMDTMDQQQQDTSRFDRAIAACRKIVGALPDGSDVMVITCGDGPVRMLPGPVIDTDAIMTQLAQLHSGYGPNRVVESLHAAAQVLSKMATSRRELVVVSDFQQTDWSSIEPATWRRLRRELAAGAITPKLIFLPVGRETSANLSVDSISFARRTIGVGQQLQVRGLVRNHGSKPLGAVTVSLAVDGTRRATQQIALGAEASSQVLFTCRLKTPGYHVLDIEQGNHDTLPTDDHRVASVRVWERIPVVLVDGNPSTKPLASETDYLAVALTPFTLGGTKLADLIETRRISPRQLTAAAIAKVRVVVLANVNRLESAALTALTQYVRNGGALLVFLGNQIDLDWYNRVLATPPASLLPMQIDSLRGRSSTESTPPTHIVSQRFEHSALSIFNDRANGDLSRAKIWKWYRLRPRVGRPDHETPAARPAASHKAVVMARFESGDPFLVQRRVGNGVVVVAATACDADWSNLPLRPVYVPLMQQLVPTLAAQVMPPVNVRTTQPLVGLLPDVSADLPFTLTAPDGVRRTLHATQRETGCVVQYAATRAPGVYTITGPSVEPLRFVASISAQESRPALLEAKTLRAIGAQLGATIVKSSSDYLRRDKEQRFGREVWMPLLFAVIGLMFLEIMLQQRFARIRT